MTPKSSQRGALLIAAVVLVVVTAVLVLSLNLMSVANVGSGSGNMQSAQALFIAEGGLERGEYLFGLGTACASVGETQSLGAGSYTTIGTAFAPASTTLSAAILSTDTVIPVASVAGYAPHGRITIGSEQIDYWATGTTAAACAPVAAPCFTGAIRGENGTTAAAHASGAAVSQNQCIIQSTGTAGAAMRIIEGGATLPNFYVSGGSTSIAGAPTVTPIATLATAIPPGDNLIIAAIAFSNTLATTDFTPGALQLVKGATTLASNALESDVGGSATPDKNKFPQETQFLLYKDAGAAANPTYSVSTTGGSNANTFARAQILIINSVPSANSSSLNGGSVAIAAGGVATTILTHGSTVPAGNNVVIAEVQLDNPSTSTVTVNSVQLMRGATVLAQNAFAINLAKNSAANRGTGLLLLGLDNGAAATPTYTVAVTTAAGSSSINAAAGIIVFNGLTAARFPAAGTANGPTVAIGNNVALPTSLTSGGLATTFSAGNNVMIAANQFQVPGAAQVNIVAPNETLTVNTPATITQSVYDMNLCGATQGGAAGVECSDFEDGYIGLNSGASANSTYDVKAAASAFPGMNGETKFLVFQLGGGNPIDWKENYP